MLIHGAASGIGSFAVQLAKARGVNVIGTASAHNLAFLHELGADETIAYNGARFEEVVAGVDVVLDTIGGETQEQSCGVLKPNGVLVALVQPPSPEKAATHGAQACMSIKFCDRGRNG